MKTNKFKKIYLIILLATLILNSVGCNSKGSNMQVLNGKDGLFAVISTEKGDIELELYYKKVPLTVINFVGLAEGTLDASKGKKYFNGLTFHRVEPGFVIQGGDPKGNGTGGPGYEFPNEIVEDLVYNEEGVLAMANAGPDTNGSQFFITLNPVESLNYNYTIFGKVVKGMDVVKSIEKNDVMKAVTIIRQGEDAQKFTATQADFDKALEKLVENKKKQYEEAVEQAKQYYAEMAKKVSYEVLKEGKGEKIGILKQVAVEYTGLFEDGKQFDSSKGRGPLEFVTGAGQMIPGFDAMVQEMKLGEKRKVTLPPETAYGEQGAGGVIPPNATIIFEIEVVSVR